MSADITLSSSLLLLREMQQIVRRLAATGHHITDTIYYLIYTRLMLIIPRQMPVAPKL